jgi:hypothetical protein
MANNDNRRDLPIPAFIGAVVLILALAGFIIWHFVGKSGPTETSDYTNMTLEQKKAHMEQALKNAPKGHGPFSQNTAPPGQSGAQSGGQEGGNTAPQ